MSDSNVFSSSINEYTFDTPIRSINLLPKYKDLITKLSIISDNGIETVQDVIDIDINKLSKSSYIGKLKINLLINLQNALKNKNDNIDLSLKIKPSEKIKLSQEQLNTPLNELALSEQHRKLIKIVIKIIGNINTVQDILNIDTVKFSSLSGVGQLYVNNLIEFQKLLPTIIEEKTNKSLLFDKNYLIDFADIDNALIEDIENYLWTLDEKKMDIALSRWGFNQQHESLEEIGKRYNVTRERIRQFEKVINTNLIPSLRIQPKVLWANIREKMTENLTDLLPNLAKCFETDKLFYEFIELCCQIESGSILKIVKPEIKTSMLDSIFCTQSSPIDQNIIINELMSNYGYSKAAAIHGIKLLEKQDKIKITEQGIYPKSLGKKEAVAHALTFHPTGLPWKDITRIINKNKFSLKLIDEERLTHGFNDSEYVYPCAKGTYRNLIFLDIEKFNIPEIMQHLVEYFNQHQLNILHLHDYFYKTKHQRTEIEYFTLRYLVREYGEDYGLYFNGISNTDNVSLDPNLKQITQSDVIIQVLNESKTPLTKQEIAERLKSKSTNHATFYINILAEEGKVIRVDQMLYTTPEKAFKNIDTQAMMKIIKDIMNASNTFVEADVFREYVNMELNLSYSKYIYVALVKLQLKELGWYRNNTIFGKTPIPYKSIFDMCKQLCKPELSNEQNTKILQQAVWLTDSVTSAAIQQWKWQMKNNF